ncbi:unnamed protein product [Phytophthora lilii]|uniref:Unnamed protein product n=1 Tax=Phytophthora lilii TaxID=2077276 RepID=A0A9W6TQK1_9STRA|nr:unnamed protein product [Phytophthora lilii]
MTILLNRKDAITPTEVRDIALTGLEAGRNSIAVTLTWVFHTLSNNPQAAEKLQSEIFTKLLEMTKSDSYVPSFEEVQDLPYMEATIHEVFRLYPTVPVIPYHCNRDTMLDDETYIPSGTDVFLYVFAAGRLSSVWGPDVMSFKPERFIDEQTGLLLQDPPANYSTFSGGPRIALVAAWRCLK